MGCCQASGISTNEICQTLSKLDLALESEKSSQHFDYIQSGPTDRPVPKYGSFDLYSLYSIDSKICEFSYGERLLCTHQPTGTIREIIVFNNVVLKENVIDYILNVGVKLMNHNHQSLIKVFQLSEDDKNIAIVTEICGETSLEKILKGKLSGKVSVEYLNQIIEGIIEYKKIGIFLHNFLISEIFLQNEKIKISPLAILSSEIEKN